MSLKEAIFLFYFLISVPAFSQEFLGGDGKGEIIYSQQATPNFSHYIVELAPPDYMLTKGNWVNLFSADTWVFFLPNALESKNLPHFLVEVFSEIHAEGSDVTFANLNLTGDTAVAAFFVDVQELTSLGLSLDQVSCRVADLVWANIVGDPFPKLSESLNECRRTS